MSHGYDPEFWHDSELHTAARQGDIERLEAYVARGDDVNARAIGRATPLHDAASSGQVAAVEALLEHGADVTAIDDEGWTPLHGAARKGSRAVCEALLNGGAAVNSTNGAGGTPLYLAAVHGARDVVELLLSRGADPCLGNHLGDTPLRRAEEKGHGEIADLLRSAQSDPAFLETCLRQHVGKPAKPRTERRQTTVPQGTCPACGERCAPAEPRCPKCQWDFDMLSDDTPGYLRNLAALLWGEKDALACVEGCAAALTFLALVRLAIFESPLRMLAGVELSPSRDPGNHQVQQGIAAVVSTLLFAGGAWGCYRWFGSGRWAAIWRLRLAKYVYFVLGVCGTALCIWRLWLIGLVSPSSSSLGLVIGVLAIGALATWLALLIRKQLHSDARSLLFLRLPVTSQALLRVWLRRSNPAATRSFRLGSLVLLIGVPAALVCVQYGVDRWHDAMLLAIPVAFCILCVSSLVWGGMGLARVGRRKVPPVGGVAVALVGMLFSAIALAGLVCVGIRSIAEVTPYDVARWRSGRDAHIPDLVAALSDHKGSVRGAAAEALASIGEPAAKPLILAFPHTDQVPRQAAREVLLKMGSAAETALMEALGQEDCENRAELVSLLAQVGSTAWAGALVDQLAQTDTDARDQAAAALLDMGERAVPALVEACEVVEGTVRAKVIQVLGEVGDARAVNVLVRALADEAVSDDAARGLTRIGKEAVPALVEACELVEGPVRAKVIQVLGKAGDPRAVDVLTRALADADEAVREDAAEGLMNMGDVGFPVLVKVLQVARGQARTKAVRLLGKTGDERAAVALVPLVLDADRTVARTAESALRRITGARGHVAVALAKVGTGAVPPLIAALSSSLPEIRRAAIEALIKIGDPRALPAMKEALADPDMDVRRAAAEALARGHLAPRGARLAALAVLVEDPSSTVRRNAIRSLAKIGSADADAVGMLVGRLKDADSHVRHSAAVALRSTDWEPRDLNEKAFYLCALHASHEVEKLHRDAVPALLHYLEHRVGVGGGGGGTGGLDRVVQLLALAGDPRAVPALLAALTDAPPRGLDEVVVISALGCIRDRRAVPALVERLGAGDRRVRKAAALALLRIADLRACGTLMVSAEEWAGDVNEWDVEALAKMRERGVADALGTIVARHEDKRVQSCALWALLERGGPEAREALRAVAMRSSSRTTLVAVRALAKTLDAQLTPVLIRALRRGGYRELQELAIGTLAEIGKPAVAGLLQALESRRKPKADLVYEALGKIGDPSGMEPLIRSVRSSDSAAEALGSIASPEATEALLDSVRYKTRLTRALAIGLGKTRDPRAVKLLFEAFADRDVHQVRADAPHLQHPRHSYSAGYGIGHTGDPKAVEALTAALTDRDPAMRAAAAYGLGHTGDARAGSPLATALKDENATVRRYAAISLGQLHHADGIESLSAALQTDEEPAVRLAAARALKVLGKSGALEALIEAFRKGQEPSLVRNAGGLLVEVAAGRDADVLVLALRHGPTWTQLEAEFALRRMGAKATGALIKELTDPSPRAKRAVAEGLLTRIGQPAVAPLVAVLGHENDAILNAAIRSLVRIGQPAVPEVTKALTDQDSRTREAAAFIIRRTR